MLTRHVAGRVYNYEYCIGRVAASGPGFYSPQDFALGSDGTLYVVSNGSELAPAQGVTKCDMEHRLIWENRGPGYASGQSPWPKAIAVDSAENVYVADDFASQIFILDKDGNYLRCWGTKGSGEGELNAPSGLAFDRDDNVYVCDGLNHRVQKFTKDGDFLAGWGSFGNGPGQFNMPWGLTLDGENNVYVADWKNDRVQKFSPDGVALATFGRSGTGNGELRRPTGVAVDGSGDVYVADWGNDRLNVYAADGSFIAAFLGDAESLSLWGQEYMDANPDYVKARRRVDLSPEWRFSRPISVRVDDEGRIMVLESQRGRIQVYVKERDFVDAALNL